MPIPESAREIIRKADEMRQKARSIDEAIGRLEAIEPVKPRCGNTITGVLVGRADVSLIPNHTPVEVDVRQILIDAYCAEATRLRDEADALEARIQVLELR